MKLLRILPITAGLLLSAVSLPAFAGTSSVSNSYSIRDIHDGVSTTNVDVHESYSGYRNAYSDAYKDEYGITVTTDGSSTTSRKWQSCGYGCSTDTTTVSDDARFEEVDVYYASTHSYASEYGTFYNNTHVDVTDTYKYDGFDKTHTVSSGFSF
jgi:hypothetical protein